MDDKQSRIDETKKFFDLLFAHVTGKHYGYLWLKRPEKNGAKKTIPYIVTDSTAREKMAKAAVRYADDGWEVYFGVNLTDVPPTPYKRSVKVKKSDDDATVTLQIATVADVDVEGGNHISGSKSVGNEPIIYPPTFDDAKFLLPFQASMLVSSGYGLHGYLIYREPVEITPENGDEAESRNAKFLELIRIRSGKYHHAVDGVHDLPRVLRVPGTFNYKCGLENPAPVKLVEVNDLRFTAAELDEKISSLMPPTNVFKATTDKAKSSATVNQNGDADARKDFSCKTREKFSPEIQALIDDCNANITPAELIAKGYLQPSANGDLCCPWCDSGHGADSSGAMHYYAEGANSHFTCFSTRKYAQPHGGDVIALYAQARGMNQSGADFFVLLKTIADEFGRPYDAKIFEREPQGDSLFDGDASDLCFARRFEKVFGDRVRWLKDDFRWLTYERNEFGGAIWRDGGDKNSCLLPFVRDVADVMTATAQTKAESELAAKIRSTRKILSSITMMKSLDSILITADDLNNHGELLNCLNGVVDLTTGKLLPAAPELLLTQQAAAAFNPKCTDTTFATFIRDVLPDDETRRAVLRYLGYCLTADVRAEKFLMIYGRGGNGKGVLLLTLRTLFGDYGVELPVDTVLEDRRFGSVNIGRATTELTPLVNRRLGIVDELPRGGRMDVAKINRLTGRDYIPIRQLHREYKDVPPSHKLVLTGNFRPRIDDPRDKALLRRLVVVNFSVDFTQNPDETLKTRLLTDAALTGALNMLVAAAVEFYRDGELLKPSPLMEIARAEYLDENDFVGEFVSEHYRFGDDFKTPRKQLLSHLREECSEADGYRDADLAAMVAKIAGITYRKGHGGFWFFYGIELKPKKEEGNDGRNAFDGGEIISSADFCPPPR